MYITVFIAAGFAALVLLLILANTSSPQFELKNKRFKDFHHGYDEKHGQTKVFYYKTYIILLYKMAKKLYQVLPGWLKVNYKKRIEKSGLQESTTVVDILTAKIAIVSVCIILHLFAYYLKGGQLQIYLLMTQMLMVSFLPDIWLEMKRRHIKESLIKEMPSAIELLSVCADSGMSLHQALKLVGSRRGGVFGKEIEKCIQEVEIGIRLQDALVNMNRRMEIQEVDVFVTAINQALTMGTPTSQIFRILAEGMREKERQNAEDAIGSIPMKLTILSMIFFMPLIFVIVLFPSLISFVQNSW